MCSGPTDVNTPSSLTSSTIAASLATWGEGPGVTVDAGYLYVKPGFDSRVLAGNQFWRQDIATKSWERLADWPGSPTASANGRCQCTTLSALGGKIYTAGGVCNVVDGTLNAVYEYDPSTNQWAEKASMNDKRYWHCVTVLDGRLFAVGGLIHNPVSYTHLTLPTTPYV